MSNNEQCDDESRSNNEQMIQQNLFRKSVSKDKLKIIHWNANSINNKQEEFKKFIIDDLQPDIVALNETKLSEFRANMILNYKV